MRNTNPGKDQKPGVVGDPTQAFSSLIAAPANPLIADRALPGGGSEYHAGQRSTRAAADPILQVLPNAAAVAQVMIATQTFLQLRTSALPAQLADLLEQEGTHARQPTLQGSLIQSQGGIPPFHSTRTSRRSHAPSRQLYPTSLLKFEQQGAGGHVFELAASGAPVPKQSQLTAQLVAAHLRILIQQGLNLGQMRRAERASLQAGWQKHSRRDWQKGRSESRKK